MGDTDISVAKLKCNLPFYYGGSGFCVPQCLNLVGHFQGCCSAAENPLVSVLSEAVSFQVNLHFHKVEP